MASDIVPVIDRAIAEQLQLIRLCERSRPVEDYCRLCQQRAKDAAQLRALRDLIEEDRVAQANWQSPLIPYEIETDKSWRKVEDAQRALLDFCREVGT